MKKLLSLLLAISLVFVFAACDSKDTPSQGSAAVNATDTFVKPEAYASVILVTINPQFRLYLDASDTVLAVEPVNDDAKSIAKDITAQTGTIEAVIENIATATNKGGFVKEDALISIEVTEIKDNNVDTQIILDKAKASADDSFKKLEVKVQIKIDVNIAAPEISDTDTSSASSSEASALTSSAASGTASTVSENKPAHTHSYAAATCTAPKKCSCGATEGKALGHSFKEGVCTHCSAKDASYVPVALSNKDGKWKLDFIGSDGCLYEVSFTLRGSANELGFSYSIGDPLSAMEQEVQDDIRKNKNEEGYKDSYVVFEGKEFWSARGSGDGIGSVNESGTTVTVTDLEGAKLVLTRTGENTMTVKESPAAFSELGKIPVGKTLTFKAK